MPVKPTTRVNQNSSCRIKFELVDFDDSGIGVAVINTATFDLKDQRTGDTINGHVDTNVKTKFDSNGNFAHVLVAADNPIKLTGKKIKFETHVMTIKISANSGGDVIDLIEEIWIEVVNLDTI